MEKYAVMCSGADTAGSARKSQSQNGCAWLGYFGMLLGLLAVLTHLSHLTSFGIPYLMPFVGADLNDYEDERDFIWRQPLRRLRRRPVYANPKERTKLTFSGKK